MNHKLQGFALKTGGFLHLIFAAVFVLNRYIIALPVVNGRLFSILSQKWAGQVLRFSGSQSNNIPRLVKIAKGLSVKQVVRWGNK